MLVECNAFGLLLYVYSSAEVRSRIQSPTVDCAGLDMGLLTVLLIPFNVFVVEVISLFHDKHFSQHETFDMHNQTANVYHSLPGGHAPSVLWGRQNISL